MHIGAIITYIFDGASHSGDSGRNIIGVEPAGSISRIKLITL